jgi:hypothetical protein
MRDGRTTRSSESVARTCQRNRERDARRHQERPTTRTGQQSTCSIAARTQNVSSLLRRSRSPNSPTEKTIDSRSIIFGKGALTPIDGDTSRAVDSSSQCIEDLRHSLRLLNEQLQQRDEAVRQLDARQSSVAGQPSLSCVDEPIDQVSVVRLFNRNFLAPQMGPCRLDQSTRRARLSFE